MHYLPFNHSMVWQSSIISCHTSKYVPCDQIGPESVGISTVGENVVWRFVFRITNIQLIVLLIYCTRIAIATHTKNVKNCLTNQHHN